MSRKECGQGRLRERMTPGRRFPIPTWRSEVLFSLPMVTRGVQSPSEFCQGRLEEMRGCQHAQNGRSSQAFCVCSSAGTQKPDDVKGLSLQPHHGKLLLKGFLLQDATQTPFPVRAGVFTARPGVGRHCWKACLRSCQRTHRCTDTNSDKGAPWAQSWGSIAHGVFAVSNCVQLGNSA